MEHQRVFTDALDRLAAGDGAGLLIEGEAGVGKSRFVEWLGQAGRDRGVHTVVGRAFDSGTPTALAPIQEALLGCSALTDADRIADLGSLAPLLAHLVPVPGVAKSDEATPTLLGHAVLKGLATLVPGVLVIIEDLHASDADTISVVRHLLSNAATHPVMVVATTRPEGPGTELISAARSSAANVLSLPRLTALECAEVVNLVLGTDDPPIALLDHIEYADGLPLVLEDLLADLMARGELRSDAGRWEFTASSGGASDRFEDVVKRRLAALDTDARAIVSAAAVLGPLLVTNVLPAASGVSEDGVAGAVRRAAGAQLLRDDGSDFRHALTRDVVLSMVPTFERSAIARRIVTHISDPPDALVAEAGEMLVLAGQHDDAARLFLRSAQEERTSGAIETAVRRLERACEVVRSQALSCEIIVLTVRLLIEMGRLSEARSLAAQREGGLPVDARVDVWLALASGDAATSDGERFDSHLLAATSLMEPDDPRRPRALALEALRMLQFSNDDDRVDRAEEIATEAARSAEAIGDHAAATDAWMIVGRCARFRNLDEAAEAYEHAHSIALTNDLSARRLQALHELGAMDMLRLADCARLELAREQAHRTGALTTLISILLNVTGCRLMQAEWEGALETSAEAELLAEQLDFALGAVMAKVWRACALGLGYAKYEEAESLHLEALATLPDDPGVRWAVDVINRIPIAAVSENHEEVMRLCAATRTQAEYMDYGAGLLLLEGARVGQFDAAHIRAELGSTPATARPLMARALEDTALAIALGREDPDEATRVANDLLELLPRGSGHCLVARRHLGEAALTDGWGDAMKWLGEARDDAHTNGHVDFVAAVERIIDRGNTSESGSASGDIPPQLRSAEVTTREWEVLCHLHDMPTNAELADRLHVSVRTMEKHVSSLLSKLQVGSRRELARLARENGWVVGPTG